MLFNTWCSGCTVKQQDTTTPWKLLTLNASCQKNRPWVSFYCKENTKVSSPPFTCELQPSKHGIVFGSKAILDNSSIISDIPLLKRLVIFSLSLPLLCIVRILLMWQKCCGSLGLLMCILKLYSSKYTFQRVCDLKQISKLRSVIANHIENE